METKNIERKDGNVRFQVTVEPERFEQEVNKAYLKNRKNILIPGFRKGKAPRKLVENLYGEGVFYEDAMEAIALECFRAGLEAVEDRTVGDPAITDYKVDDDKSLTISFEVALYPEVTLGQYKGLSAYKPAVNVTDEQVDAELRAVQKRNARFLAVDRPAQNGDTLLIDFDGYLNGKRFKGGKAENYKLKLGSGTFIPGFEDQLVGAVAEEERDLPVTFPEDYGNELGGKDAVFKVKVHEVQEEQLPELDDDFAQDVSEYDTLEAYRDSLRRDLETKAEERNTAGFRSALMSKAAEGVTVSIPDVMIKARLEAIVEEYSRSVSVQGYTLDQYLAMLNMNEAGFRSFMRPQAESEVRSELMLEKIAQLEGLIPTAEEIEEEYKKSAEKYEMDLDYLKSVLKEEVVKGELTRKKAADFILANGVATDKPESEQDEAAPAEAEASAEAEAPAEVEAPAAAPEKIEAPAAPEVPEKIEAPAAPEKIEAPAAPEETQV